LILTPLLTQSYGVQGLIVAFLVSSAIGTAYGYYLARSRFDIEFAKMALIKIYVASLVSALPALAFLYASQLPRMVNVVVGAMLYLITYIIAIPVLRAITLYELETLALVLNRIRPLNRIVKPLLNFEKRILKNFGT
jgi:hypothetical protein